MVEALSHRELIEALARIEAGLADASYRVGRLRNRDRKSRDLGAVSLNIQGARRDVVTLLEALGAYNHVAPEAAEDPDGADSG